MNNKKVGCTDKPDIHYGKRETDRLLATTGRLSIYEHADEPSLVFSSLPLSGWMSKSGLDLALSSSSSSVFQP